MKKWYTIQNMGEEICEIDKITQMQRQSGIKELNAAQGSHIGSVVKKLYIKGGKNLVCKELITELRSRDEKAHQSTGLTVGEKKRALEIVEGLFKWYWFPFSKIQFNMRRLTK